MIMLLKRLLALLIAAVNALLGNSIPSPCAVLAYDSYNLKTYMSPVWSGDIVYNETLMFVQNKDGTVDPAPLLYYADEILSVRSYDLKTIYAEGVDYKLVGGCVVLTEDTGIYAWPYKEYYPPESIEGHTFERSNGCGFIYFSEGPAISLTQVVVTYRHSDVWSGIVPENQTERLPLTTSKLKSNEPLTILFYGDSITVGGNSSAFVGIEPFAPIWSIMVVDTLAEVYANSHITYINTAVGGTASGWGAENVEERVNAHNPDLVVIAFGGNDIKTNPIKFCQNINSIMKSCRESNPDVEFILVSPEQTSKAVKGFYGNQFTFEEMLYLLAENTKGTALAPVWSVHTNILRHKRYYDSTANNVNHVNDFMARVYAQTVAEIFLGSPAG
ncbi:MAG: SGNH/GDSL hydrolase family protein [Eubacteriales bacterium]